MLQQMLQRLVQLAGPSVGERKARAVCMGGGMYACAKEYRMRVWMCLEMGTGVLRG